MLKPDYCCNSVLEITSSVLKKLKVKALILDVDNTLRAFGEMELRSGVVDWIEGLKKEGILITIASNNFRKNVEPVAFNLKLDFVSLCCKPLPFGLNLAKTKLDVSKERIAVVGDQLFTDILGGKVKGFKTILVRPIVVERGFLWKIKREIEKLFLKRLI